MASQPSIWHIEPLFYNSTILWYNYRVAINIKNEETARLTVELAKKTGLSLTQAITVAVKEKLARLNHSPDGEEELMALALDTSKRLIGLDDHAKLLYDERGLPG